MVFPRSAAYHPPYPGPASQVTQSNQPGVVSHGGLGFGM